MKEKVPKVHSCSHESVKLANKYDIYDIVNMFIKFIETYLVIVLAQRSATESGNIFLNLKFRNETVQMPSVSLLFEISGMPLGAVITAIIAASVSNYSHRKIQIVFLSANACAQINIESPRACVFLR